MSGKLVEQFIGIDGCPEGWMVVAYKDNNWFAQVFDSIDPIFQQYGLNATYLVDMPMGLADTMVSRSIERELRQILSPVRHQSVFTPPVRDAVYAEDYRQALSINRSQVDKGISIQAWNISKKIRELDEFLQRNHEAKSQFYESHPELCFHRLNSGHIIDSKHTKDGRNLRKSLLLKNAPGLATVLELIPNGGTEMDLLDASVLAITAMSTFSVIRNSMEFDSRQIPIRLVY